MAEHVVRSKNLGVIKEAAEAVDETQALSIFKKACLIRDFEFGVKKAFDGGFIKCPIYLAVGQEVVPAAISEVYKRPAIFAQHRCHGWYLAYGGDIQALIDELLQKPTGCAKGMGGSASIQSPGIGMFGHSGFMGDQVPIATGFALGSRKKTLAIMGDASAEEDYVAASLGYAAHKKLPILFVCEDNNLSILTEVSVRRNWKMADVARSFGMPAFDVADDPWTLMHYAKELQNQLPAFLNIHVSRHLWHSGTGKDNEPEWDRLGIMRETLLSMGLGKKVDEIEQSTKVYIGGLWEKAISNK